MKFALTFANLYCKKLFKESLCHRTLQTNQHLLFFNASKMKNFAL